ncbi:2-oxo-4-hydroxy-4-carboxy-5-ureidoimidazoline decarboxylase isoform X1 [Paramormyrops kingsleyae]|uniref:2-oxo-4-hydroxy-4-carboxy-5-ureidoimidazoline decarboxylase isoform X1 n=2 Tax=Paramormyrops kingsleyae TaxID=1676925 RepID=UPI003B97642D
MLQFALLAKSLLQLSSIRLHANHPSLSCFDAALCSWIVLHSLHHSYVRKAPAVCLASGGRLPPRCLWSGRCPGDFLEIFGNVVEKCPLITAAVWSARPFATLADMEARIAEFIDSLPAAGKAGILRCHPDLAGRDLQSGTLTAESEQEQVVAGLRSLEPADATRLRRLNLQYKERFGYPFVICAGLNDRAAILRQLAERFANEPQRELPLAIEEVKKICCLRLRRIVASDIKL